MPKFPRPRPSDTQAPDQDDATLFRDAIGRVREMQPVPEPIAPPRPAPHPRQRDADEREALRQMREAPFRIEAGDVLQYRRPEVAPKVLKRLRQGLYAVQDEIDLHGMTALQAEQVLRLFLQQARSRARHCVRVVHGKGLRSQGTGPVLKQQVERLLTQRRDVLAFASAPSAMGGSGAVLVLLARLRPGEQSISPGGGQPREED
jgi:DNA-nicking Smr family endonuclease